MKQESSKRTAKPEAAPTLTLGLVLAASLLFLVRHDLWLSESSTLVAGLPVSLLYHLLFCFAVSAVLAVFVFGRPAGR